MPSLLELLLQPWKLFSPTTFSTASIATQLTPASGCYTKDLGDGDLQNLCRILGYEMPGFIFFAAIVILVLFATAVFSLTRESVALQAALKDLESHLKHVAEDESALSEAQANELGERMRTSPLHESIWLDLRDQWTESPKSGSTISSQVPMSEAFSFERVSARALHEALYGLVPGILTGLGLLMTFVAILDGLSHVSVTREMDVKGIAGLINGLSGKFFSSVVAVFCAVSFSLVERMLLRSSERTHRNILRFLQHRVRSVGAESWFKPHRKTKG